MTDCWVHLLYNSTCKFHQLYLGSSCQGNRYAMEKAGGTARPSRTNSRLPGHSPPASQGGLPCWASPLVFGLIGKDRQTVGATVPGRLRAGPGAPCPSPAGSARPSVQSGSLVKTDRHPCVRGATVPGRPRAGPGAPCPSPAGSARRSAQSGSACSAAGNLQFVSSQ